MYFAPPYWRHGRLFPDDPSAQLPLRTPSPPSARPALAEEGCGDGPVTMTSFDHRQMLLSLMEACDYPRHHSSAHAVDAVALTSRLSIIRKLRIEGHAAIADRMTYRLENIFLNMNLLTDSARVGLSQFLRAFLSSATLPFCPACAAACSKVESFEDLSRLLLHDCPCRPSPVSTASGAATAACAPADRDA
jgi:hypothetical protein